MKFDLELYKKIWERRARTDIQITTDKEFKPITRDDIISIQPLSLEKET